MKKFFNAFFTVFGILTATLLFIFILTAISNLLYKKQKSDFSYHSGNKESKNNIALLKISGPIISEPTKIYNINIFNSLDSIYPTQIKNYLSEINEKNVLGLIISINTPGGSVTATQEVYKLIKDFKAKNNIPIYFHTNSILASGGYWISLSGDKIFADYGAIIGSIGVKGPDWIYYNSPTSLSQGIFGNQVTSPKGIQVFSNTAGISKDIFNPFRAPSNEEISKLQEMVDDIYEDFISIVSKNRKIKKTTLKNEIKAMIFNTNQASKYQLIDGQKNIEDLVEVMKTELDLNDSKIISNHRSEDRNIINSIIYRLQFNESLSNQYREIIKNKFCNNFNTEFSTALINSYKTNCI